MNNTSELDFSPDKNPAKYPALKLAQERANKEGKGMVVYVAAPDTHHAFKNTDKNVWYVRPYNAPQPPRSEIYQIFSPNEDSHL